ncbi:MAG: hypothetical protein JWQ09_3325 [Segetibacter sp.]|nr:hypothetical protein [Segetibacter sp.]
MNSFLKTILSSKVIRRLSSNGIYYFTCMQFLSLCFVLIAFSNPCLAQLTYKELKVQYDSAWTFKNLQIIPVRYKSGEGAPATGPVNGPRPLSLSEALQKHKIKLQEMQYEKGADVNWLQVTNNSKQDVVIQSGEILDGGKQDRMVGETKIVAAGSTDYLHVFCVEKRRWADKPKAFKTADVANSELQKTMNVKGRQSEVWKEIDRQFAANNKKSETFSYLELYNNAVREDSDYIRYFLKRYSETDSTFAGYIFITGNKIISTELFATAALTNISFRNMLSSYVQTARANGAPPKVPVTKMKEFMDKVLMNEPAQKIYVTAHGKLQVSDGKVIHLVAYDD